MFDAKQAMVVPMCALLGLALAGCASKNPPLMFGDGTTFGIRIGNDTATGGASVSLGLKAQSVALVPITYNDTDGWAKTIKAASDGMIDAMSVFAVFGSDAPGDETGNSKKVGLGQMFATGLAAQDVTTGYICRAQKEDCKVTQPKAEDLAKDAAASANTAAAQARAAAALAANAAKSAMATQPPAPTPDDNRVYDPQNGPYQRPLVFLRTDTFGFDMGGSLAEKGLQFVLGYNNRNLAFIPTYSSGQNKKVGTIMGGDPDTSNSPDKISVDTLSVFGQFRASTQTARLGYDLERFFATGVAARNMGKAARVSIAATAPAPQQPASAAGK